MKFKRIFLFSVIVSLTVVFAACSINNYYARFYDGPLRPAKDVALLVLDLDCYLNGVKQEGIEKKIFALKGGELLPGSYQLAIGYTDVGNFGKTYTSKGSTYIEINAQAGHTYFIYPVILSNNRAWQPKAIDIAGEADYHKIKDPGDRDWVKRKTEEYLSGDRRVLKPDPDSPGTWW